jgi:hypothetical protein
VGGRGIFSVFLCSQNVPFKFPMGSIRFSICSPRVFTIAPRSNPICFAQSPPPSHLCRWAEGGGTPSFHRIFYLGSLHSFNRFLQWANQIHLLQKKKVGLVRHPQQINMKQNKYPWIQGIIRSICLSVKYIWHQVDWYSGMFKFSDLSSVIPTSVAVPFSTDFSFQNLVFWSLFEFSATEIT